MTRDKTRVVSKSELKAMRRSKGAATPQDAPSESSSPSDSFDPGEILQHWSPEQRDAYWNPSLKMDTRVKAPGPPRRTGAQRTSRTTLLVSGILIVAMLIAIGLFMAIQLLEPTDGADETGAPASWIGEL